MSPLHTEVRVAIKRFLTKRLVPSALFALVPAALQTARWVPQPSVVRAFALVVIATGIGHTIRMILHVADGYLSWKDAPHRLLTCLVGFDALLTTLWIWSGVAMAHTPKPLPQGLTCAFLFFAVPTVAAWTVATARRVKKRRGSEYLRTLPFAKALQDIQRRMNPLGPMRFFTGLWKHKTNPTEISAFVVFVATVLMTVALADAPQGAVELARWLDSGHPTVTNAGDSGDKSTTRLIAPGATGGTPRAGAPASTPPSPSRPRPKGEEPSYQQQCGAFPVAHDMPPAQAEVLHDLWLGGHGRTGAGAGEAGCAEEPQAVAGHPDVWWAVGVCGSEIRSLGVAAAGRAGGLLFQQPARFAYARALDGTLLWATSRIRVGAGDLYLVDTVSGTYVLVRAQSARGAVKPPVDSSSCKALTNENVRYVILPPALAARWVVLVREQGWTWPTRDDSRGVRGTAFVFVRDSPGADVIAKGSCTAGSCELLFRGGAIPPQPQNHLTLDDLLAHAPAPPADAPTAHP